MEMQKMIERFQEESTEYFGIFNAMFEYSIANGMTNYQSDLMHDAVEIFRNKKNVFKRIFIVRGNGCGTNLLDESDFHNVKNAIPIGAMALLGYDGEKYYFHPVPNDYLD